MRRPPHSLLTATLTFTLLFLTAPPAVLAHPQEDIDTSDTPRYTAPPDSEEFTDDDAFRDAVLNGTNTYRAQHNATALEWNETSAEAAQEWADACVFEHSGGPTGENLAAGYLNATAAIAAWGEERAEYSFASGDFSTETGHFTQLVWKDTTSVGCARADCGPMRQGEAAYSDEGEPLAWGWYVVCEYYPAGNVMGNFGENVQEGKAAVKGRRASGLALAVGVAAAVWAAWW